MAKNLKQTHAPMVPHQIGDVYFLTQILNDAVMWRNTKIGTLSDVVILDSERVSEVTHFIVSRPFGRPVLIIPLNNVTAIDDKRIMVDIENEEQYQSVLKPDAVLLKDHILDKKVLDIEDREVEVVYDIKLTLINGKFYVTNVDLSRYGLLKRMHLKWLANLIYQSPKEREMIPWTYIQPLPTNLSSFKGEVKLNVLKEKLSDIPPADLADILEEMDREQRAAVFSNLETTQASDTLEEIDPSVQRDLIDYLHPEKVVKLINEMTPGQAADFLSVLPMDVATNFLKLMEPTAAKKVGVILNNQDVNILNFATQNYIKLTPERTVRDIQEEYPQLAKGKEVVMYLYIVDTNDKLLGVINLTTLLAADDNARLKDIMNDVVISLNTASTLKEAFHLFVRYSFRALPITDQTDKILGVVSYRDIMTLKHRVLE